MTAVRMWKVTKTKLEELGIDKDLNATVADYLSVLEAEALDEMASK